MKKLLLIGLATLSSAALHAADLSSTDSGASGPKVDPQTPPPPSAHERGGRHGGDGKMMLRGPEKRGPGGMKHDCKDGKGEGMRRGGPERFRAKGGPGGPRRDGPPMADALKLTDEQRAKAKELMEATRPKIEAIRKEEREKVKAVMDEARKELRPLLTPEQQAVFDSLEKLRADKAALDAARSALAGKPAPETKPQP